MISLINDVTRKDKRIITQQKKAETLGQQVKSKDNKITTQQKQTETLEQQVKDLEKKIEQMKEVDMNLKGKKKLSPTQ
jgi:cell division protein FtsL